MAIPQTPIGLKETFLAKIIERAEEVHMVILLLGFDKWDPHNFWNAIREEKEAEGKEISFSFCLI
jgi:hypothetical protein